MKGSVIINQTDIADFGAFILRGGDHELLLFPERKEPKQNNWYEYDGLDVDLSEVFFKERSLSINFYLSAGTGAEYEFKLNEFYRLLTSGYISLYSRELGQTFTLRYLSVTEYNHKGGLYKSGDKRGWVKVNFSMDDPLQLFTRPDLLMPKSSKTSLTHVSLNGYDLGKFGIIVNECYSSVLKQPAIKPPLTRSFARRSGLLAFARQRPTFEARELVIKCTMRAPDRAEFYHNYEALFNNLTSPEAIQIDTFAGRANCYYSKMESWRKLGVFSNGVMVQFTLRLKQIDAGLTYYVLGTASDTAILTDANEFILI